MKVYEELEAKRKELYSEYIKDKKKGDILLISSLIAFLLPIFLIKVPILGPILTISSIIGFIIGIIFQASAAKINTRFQDLVKNQFVSKILDEHFEHHQFEPKGSISPHKINSTGLVRKPDRFRGEDLITGAYKNVAFQVSDVVLTEVRVTSNGKSTTTQYIDYFKGRWYVYKFEKSFEHTIKIVENKYGTSIKGLKKYETEMIDFNKKFSIYSSDEQFFYYMMNPYLIEKLLELEGSHRGSIYYCIKDDELHIGVNDSSDSLIVNFKKEINEKSLERFIEDIVLIKTIIDEFRLYDIKFRK